MFQTIENQLHWWRDRSLKELSEFFKISPEEAVKNKIIFLEYYEPEITETYPPKEFQNEISALTGFEVLGTL